MTNLVRKKLDIQAFLKSTPKNSGYQWNSTKAQIWDCIDSLIYASTSIKVTTIGDAWLRDDKIEAAKNRAVLRFQAHMIGWDGENFTKDILKLIEDGDLK